MARSWEVELDPQAMHAALQALAPRLVPGGGEIGDLRRLSGGASQETWAFIVNDGARPTPLIMRRRPAHALGEAEGRALPLAMEARLIRAAAAQGAPTPDVIHVCAAEDGLGEAYVMARVAGETLGSRIVRNEAFAKVRPGLARRCGEVLGRIHATSLDPLAELPMSDAASELARYEAVYRGLDARRPVFEAALAHLKAHAPPLVRPVLAHGDFRNGNLIVDPERGLAAVLDWELAHRGDPAEDLGWICVNSWRFGEHRKPVGGFGTYEDLLEGYAAAGGEPPSLERLLYWQMLGSLKWGVMCLMMYASYAVGADLSVERAMIGRRASETEIDLVALLERAA